jgi:hypothetical protein
MVLSKRATSSAPMAAIMDRAGCSQTFCQTAYHWIAPQRMRDHDKKPGRQRCCLGRQDLGACIPSDCWTHQVIDVHDEEGSQGE